MLVTKNRYQELEKMYKSLVKKFAEYKQMYNYENCNNSWRYDQLMARSVKLKKENKVNIVDKALIEKLTEKLIKVTAERDYLKTKTNTAISNEVDKIIHEEVNLVFKKNAKVNEELLQAKEEIKWVKWYLKSLKDIYLSEGNSSTKNIILDKLSEGIPECYREILEDIFESGQYKGKIRQFRAH